MNKQELYRFIKEVVAKELEEVSNIFEPKRPSGTPMDKLGLTPNGGLLNILNIYNEATPEEKEYWGKWYHNAKKEVEELAAKYNVDFFVTAALVAVLSPGNRWRTNLIAAEKMLSGVEKINAYPKQLVRANQILKTGDVSLVTGPKVTVFFKSLIDPVSVEQDMVLDGHAINIWRGAKTNLKGLKNPVGKERELMIKDYQTAAKQLGVSVQAIQAVTWYIWKSTGKLTKLSELEEANGIAAGGVVGTTGSALGVDTEPAKKLMWSGDEKESR